MSDSTVNGTVAGVRTTVPASTATFWESLWLSELPGLALCGAIALAAFGLRWLPGLSALSPLILAMVIGVAVRNFASAPSIARPGIVFAIRRLLRWGVALLGLQMTVGKIAAIGVNGAAIIVLVVVGTLAATVALGRLFGVERRLAQLIAVGTSICGASAVIGANTVVEAHDEDVAYSVACVTVFGTLSMVAYPLLLPLIGLGPHEFGMWAGASIHEVAQVVGAAFQGGPLAGEVGTAVKLGRVVMLAPVVLALGFMVAKGRRGSAPKPWFVLAFVVFAAIASLGVVPPQVSAVTPVVTQVLLTIALAAMGLETDVRKLRAKGWRPLALAAAATLFIAVFSLGLVHLLA